MTETRCSEQTQEKGGEGSDTKTSRRKRGRKKRDARSVGVAKRWHSRRTKAVRREWRLPFAQKKACARRPQLVPKDGHRRRADVRRNTVHAKKEPSPDQPRHKQIFVETACPEGGRTGGTPIISYGEKTLARECDSWKPIVDVESSSSQSTLVEASEGRRGLLGREKSERVLVEGLWKSPLA